MWFMPSCRCHYNSKEGRHAYIISMVGSARKCHAVPKNRPDANKNLDRNSISHGKDGSNLFGVKFVDGKSLSLGQRSLNSNPVTFLSHVTMV